MWRCEALQHCRHTAHYTLHDYITYLKNVRNIYILLGYLAKYANYIRIYTGRLVPLSNLANSIIL